MGFRLPSIEVILLLREMPINENLDGTGHRMCAMGLPPQASTGYTDRGVGECMRNRL